MNLTEQLKHWKVTYLALCEKDEEKAAAANMKHFEEYFNHLNATSSLCTSFTACPQEGRAVLRWHGKIFNNVHRGEVQAWVLGTNGRFFPRGKALAPQGHFRGLGTRPTRVAPICSDTVFAWSRLPSMTKQ